MPGTKSSEISFFCNNVSRGSKRRFQAGGTCHGPLPPTAANWANYSRIERLELDFDAKSEFPKFALATGLTAISLNEARSRAYSKCRDDRKAFVFLSPDGTRADGRRADGRRSVPATYCRRTADGRTAHGGCLLLVGGGRQTGGRHTECACYLFSADGTRSVPATYLPAPRLTESPHSTRER